MQPQTHQAMRWIPLLALAIVGMILGVGVGYLVWSPGASNYGVVSTANEETRTVWIHQMTVTYPSAVFAKAGSDSSINITLTNVRQITDFIVVSLETARNNGVDATTISEIATAPYTMTLPSFGTASHVASFKPTNTGYAIFDLTINGELAGTITLYVVPS